MEDRELDIRLMELCEKELRSLPQNSFRAEALKYYIKQYEKLIGV